MTCLEQKLLYTLEQLFWTRNLEPHPQELYAKILDEAEDVWWSYFIARESGMIHDDEGCDPTYQGNDHVYEFCQHILDKG